MPDPFKDFCEILIGKFLYQLSMYQFIKQLCFFYFYFPCDVKWALIVLQNILKILNGAIGIFR